MTALMSPDRLERLRAAAERTLSTTCTIEPPVSVSDGAGGRTVTYGAAVTVAASMALPVARELTEAAARFGVAPAALVRTPWDTVAPELARLTIDGTVWTVVGSMTRGETWKVLERLAVVPA